MSNNSNVLNIIADNNQHMKWIVNNTILLVRHGSHAYGTNTPSSDEDFKGVTIPPKEYFFGFSKHFEQAELKAPNPDAVIYDIRKFFNLAADCNPNIIEVLHTDESDHLLVSPLGKKLLDHKNDFLSKRIKHTFLGYAVSQLKRIKTHKKWILNPPVKNPSRTDVGLPEQTVIPKDQLVAAFAEVQKELDKMNFDFMDSLEESAKIEIRNNMAQMLSEMKITSDEQFAAAARKIGLNDNFIHFMQKEREYSSLKREWDQYQNWKLTRNVARAELEEKYGYDTKHAYHLVRLIRMCNEILETGKVLVKRPDRDELLAIRNGSWSYDKLMQFVETEELKLNKLYNDSTMIPKSPNRDKLDNLCISLIEEFMV